MNILTLLSVLVLALSLTITASSPLSEARSSILYTTHSDSLHTTRLSALIDSPDLDTKIDLLSQRQCIKKVRRAKRAYEKAVKAYQKAEKTALKALFNAQKALDKCNKLVPKLLKKFETARSNYFASFFPIKKAEKNVARAQNQLAVKEARLQTATGQATSSRDILQGLIAAFQTPGGCQEFLASGPPNGRRKRKCERLQRRIATWTTKTQKAEEKQTAAQNAVTAATQKLTEEQTKLAEAQAKNQELFQIFNNAKTEYDTAVSDLDVKRQAVVDAQAAYDDIVAYTSAENGLVRSTKAAFLAALDECQGYPVISSIPRPVHTAA